jgi:hypothetical protein
MLIKSGHFSGLPLITSPARRQQRAREPMPVDRISTGLEDSSGTFDINEADLAGASLAYAVEGRLSRGY